MKFMQITTKNGTHYRFGVTDFREYERLKKKIILSCKRFVDVVDSCSIRKREIVSIEYFEHQEETE